MTPRQVAIDEARKVFLFVLQLALSKILGLLLAARLGIYYFYFILVFSSSLRGCLISFFFAVGDTWCFHFPMFVSPFSLLAAYGCST